jgi:hypothetical protein
MKTFLTKGLLFSVLAISALSATAAHAFPTRAEMEANYQICEQSDASWHRRWGQYVVAFDIDEASRACRKGSVYGERSEPELMGCEHQGRYLWAGYYCHEISGFNR